MMRPLHAGFTLLELIVVLLLISLVTALIFPRLPSSQASDLRNSARQLAVLMRYLEERAVATKKTYYLRINLDDDRLSVSRKEPASSDTPQDDDPFLKRQPLVKGIRVSDITTDQLGTINTGEALISYGPGGRSAPLLLHLVAPDNSYFTIQALPVSGSIKVASGYQETIL